MSALSFIKYCLDTRKSPRGDAKYRAVIEDKNASDKQRQIALRKAMQEGEKAQLFVGCSTNSGKGYILHLRVLDDVAYAYEKEVVNNKKKTDNKQVTMIKSITGKLKLTGDISYRCPHCANVSLFKCTCGTCSCLDLDKAHMCPTCSEMTLPPDRSDLTNINATSMLDNAPSVGASGSKLLAK